jgi:hypothetical protein
MPIIEPAPPEDPLSHGDILKGIALFATPPEWTDVKKAAKNVDALGCLVVSRPCILQNKNRKQVIALAIDKYLENVPDVSTLDLVLDFLEGARDGMDAPDSFYLGQIPDLGAGRLRARLDSFHSIRLPETAELKRLLPTLRVGRLCADFHRDLHTRVFSTFASLGFEDISWFTNEDLEWVISVGDAEEGDLRASIEKAKSGAASLDKPTKALADHQSRLKRFKEERERRKKT